MDPTSINMYESCVKYWPEKCDKTRFGMQPFFLGLFFIFIFIFLLSWKTGESGIAVDPNPFHSYSRTFISFEHFKKVIDPKQRGLHVERTKDLKISSDLFILIHFPEAISFPGFKTRFVFPKL